MNCIIKLREMREIFTKTEVLISEYILDNLKIIKKLRAKELAELVGVSQPSIIRFSKKLGYKGFPEFKIAFSEAIVEKKSFNTSNTSKILHDKISLDDSNLDIVNKVSYQNIEAIKNTESILNLENLENTVKLIKKSKRIYVLGAGFSGLVAKNLMYKLLEINYNVMYIEDSHILLTSMNNTTKDDLIFAISHSGRTSEVIKSVEVAKKNKAKIITLTKMVENPLEKLGDIAIKTVAENENLRLTAISSTITQLTVIDAIYMLLMKLNYEKNYSLTKKNSKIVEILKVK